MLHLNSCLSRRKREIMRSKLILGMILILLFVGLSKSILNTQPVRANEPVYIYIRADGSIDPPAANITNLNNINYTFTDDNWASIVIERDNIVVDGASYILHGTTNEAAINLTGRSNVIIKNVEIWGTSNYCIYLNQSSNITISWNSVGGTSTPITLANSSNNIMFGNNVTNCGGCFWLKENSNNNQIYENKIYNYSYWAIDIGSNSNNTIFGNSISGGQISDWGIVVGGFFNTICENNITNVASDAGILLAGSNNSIYGNKIANNTYGVTISWGANNTIYHNNFIDNNQQVYSPLTPVYANIWDDGYPSGGNYWNNYDGIDLLGGPYQNVTGRDGIGDIPYVVATNNTDRYPLMEPWPCQITPSSVGGVQIPIDKLALVAPCIASAAIIVAVAVGSAYAGKRWLRKTIT